MRTSRRNFVVEYKTSRHQTKTRPGSIWGNLDLQAVARAVEMDGHLPDADRQRAASSQQEAIEADVAAIAPNARLAADIPTEPHAESNPPTASLEDFTTSRKESAGLDDNVLKQSHRSAPEQPSRPENTERTKSDRRQVSAEPLSLDDFSTPTGLSAFEGELAALEAQNRHLKRLMIAKLREENGRLRSMLRRFGTG